MNTMTRIDAPSLADRRIPTGNDFLTAEQVAQITPDELIRRTSALQPLIAEHAAEAERLRRPVDAVWQALRDSGYFYMFVPRVHGGLEFDPDTFISATLPIAEADPSTGWVASFCAEHNWLIAQMPEKAQAEVWNGNKYAIAPSVASPPGQARIVDGGFTISGHWKWGTGIMHADWAMLNALVPTQAGPPAMHMFLIPASEVTVLDTWHMEGMAATGSNDLVLEDAFVPAHRCFEVGPVRSGRGHAGRIYDNPLYKAPMLPQLCVAAAIPAIGAARAAVRLCNERLRKHVKMGTETTSVEKPAAQMRLARADILVDSAELMLRTASRRSLEIGVLDEPEQITERIRLRAQIAYAVSQCVDAVRTTCEAVGSSVHALSNPMQRLLRDIQVMQSHIVYDLDVATELHGRTLVGLPPNSVLL
ncbi:putative Pigment production hydroxylase [Novosphingobium sp. KN65.2]|nr:putative Pigment production hydroxylase [Novosphingobium sp. KN65.2]